jgi:WD40 repeat protein
MLSFRFWARVAVCCLVLGLVGCGSASAPDGDRKEPVDEPAELDRVLGTGRGNVGQDARTGHRFVHFGTGRVVMTYNGEAGNLARVYSIVDGRPLTPPLKHTAVVNDATLSPDGSRVLTASQDRTVRVWDVATGNVVGAAFAHDEEVASATFSPDGKQVLTAVVAPRKGFGAAHLWDVTTGQRIGAPLAHEDMVMCAAFSPDGRQVVTGCADGAAYLWSATTGKRVGAPMKHRYAVVYAEFSPDGTKVVTAAGQEQTARVWDAGTGKAITPLLEQGHRIPQAIFTPDGKSVVTVNIGLDKTVQFWDATSGKKTKALQAHVWLSGVAMSRDGRGLLTLNSGDNKVSTWRAKEDGEYFPAGDVEYHPTRIGDDSYTRVPRAVFSPDGSRIVTLVSHRGSSRNVPDQYVHVWDLAKTERIAVVKNRPD